VARNVTLPVIPPVQEIDVKKLGMLLLAAPIGYVLLTGYLLAKTRPVPITVLSSAHAAEEEERLELLAA
jgi:hypothetical protein